MPPKHQWAWKDYNHITLGTVKGERYSAFGMEILARVVGRCLPCSFLGAIILWKKQILFLLLNLLLATCFIWMLKFPSNLDIESLGSVSFGWGATLFYALKIFKKLTGVTVVWYHWHMIDTSLSSFQQGSYGLSQREKHKSAVGASAWCKRSAFVFLHSWAGDQESLFGWCVPPFTFYSKYSGCHKVPLTITTLHILFLQVSWNQQIPPKTPSLLSEKPPGVKFQAMASRSHSSIRRNTSDFD